MKASKIFAFALAALMTTACSNDDDEMTYNTNGGVTVEMEESNVDVMENKGIFTVPMVVNGERNGYITVTVECTESGTDGAVANRHYYLTSDKINIPADAKTADVEFRTQDFRGADPDRSFDVKIVSVQGGAIGANASTTVTILDKGSSPAYDDIPGNYLMTFLSMNDDEENPAMDVENVDNVIISKGTPDGNGGGTLIVTGIMGMFQMELTYDYDPTERYGELVFNYGTLAAVGTQFDRMAWVNSMNDESGEPVIGKWNASYSAVTFGDDSSVFGIGVFDPGFLGVYDRISKFTILKAKN